MTDTRASMPYEEPPVVEDKSTVEERLARVFRDLVINQKPLEADIARAVSKHFWTLVMCLLLLAGNAWAADGVVCMDIDNDGTYDTLLPSGVNDRDCDGYTTAQGDCDDTKPYVYPGVTWDDAGTIKLCNAAGTGAVTTPSTPLCEATGGGSCYYVDVGTGSDANAGTYASPFATFEKLCDYESAGSRPAGWVNLGAGDVVYLKGSTDVTTDYDPGATVFNVVCYLTSTQSGDASYPVTFKRYPGATAKFNGKQPIYSVGATYIHVVDYKATGMADGNPLNFNSGSNITIDRANLYSTQCARANNCACIKLTGITTATVTHSRMRDCYDGTDGYNENVSLLVAFEGEGHNWKWNEFSYTSTFTSGNTRGQGAKWKHGNTGGATTVSDISGNRFHQIADTAINVSQDKLNIHHNLCIDCQRFYHCSDLGGGGSKTYCRTHDVYNNTMSTTTSGSYQLAGFTSPNVSNFDDVTIRNNAVRTTGRQMIQLMQYGSNADYTTVTGTDAVLSNGNIYSSSGGALQFDIFSDVPSGASGQIYGLPGYQSFGDDTGSVESNPTFDSYYRVEAGGYESKGWRATTDLSGGGGGGSSGGGFIAAIY
jgi:hypothetical protein